MDKPDVQVVEASERVPGCPTSRPENCPSPIDRNKLLEMFDQDRSFINDLLELFVKETRNDIAKLEAACARRDSGQIAVLAHRIKGAAANLTAEPLRRDAAQIEALGRTGRLAELPCTLAQLQDDVEALNRFVTGSSPQA